MSDFWVVTRRCALVEKAIADMPNSTLLECAYAALDRMIAEHEPAPVDQLYEAMKAVVELGRYDTREQTQLLRGELEARGLKIVEATPTQPTPSV